MKVMPAFQLIGLQRHAGFISWWGAEQAMVLHPDPKDPWWIWQVDRDPNAKFVVVED